MLNPVARGWIIAVTALLVGVAPAAHAEFAVKRVSAHREAERVSVNAEVVLNLTPQAQSAVDNGVPLVILTEVAVVRPGAFWSETVTERTVRRRLRYHALSDRYIVEGNDPGEFETFRSAAAALKRLGQLRGLMLTVAQPPAGDLMVAIRSRLDVNALPPPMRPMALFSADWQLSSNWTRWAIEN